MMQADEAGTLAALKSRRTEILQPLVSKHHGRIIKVMGDGVLVEFASAVQAVTCAVALQEAMALADEPAEESRRVVLRIGINLGDVMVEGSDLYGDGVNIAARLEALAEPGKVFISGKVRQEVANKLKLSFDDLGEQSLKNVAETVRVYRVSAPAETTGDIVAGKTVEVSKPSIAVLPFTNMSGDPDQEYFSDGITEDIITDLSQVSALFVASRNSAFTFKGKAVEVVEAARKLHVGYVLEGSVRRAGNRVRITAQLIDGSTGGHLWAERYDRDFGDIFALQDDISKKVVSALKVKLLPNELEAITKPSTTNAQAYEHYLKGRSILYDAGWGNKTAVRSARQQFSSAVELDPGYARAYAGIADCDAFLWRMGEFDISAEDILANSTKALALAPNLAEAHGSHGIALYAAGHFERAAAAFERAFSLDSGLSEAYYLLCGVMYRNLGRYEKAVALLERGAELHSDDYKVLIVAAEVYLRLGLQEKCVAAAKRALVRIEAALNRHPDDPLVLAWAAANAVFLGDHRRAVEWANRAIALSPNDPHVRMLAACAFASAGMSNVALECLEYLFVHFPRTHQFILNSVRHDVQLEPLHNLAEFQALVTRLESAVAEQHT
jgi:adenylate cyclase